MRGKVFLLLTLVWTGGGGVASIQIDPWRFVDEATRVHRDEKTGYQYRNAVGCPKPNTKGFLNTKDFLLTCFSDFFEGPKRVEFFGISIEPYAGEEFSLGKGYRLELEVTLSSLKEGTLFAQELMKPDVKGALDTLYADFVRRVIQWWEGLGSLIGLQLPRWPLRVYVPQGKAEEMDTLCSLYAPLVPGTFSKVEVFARRGEDSFAPTNVLLVDMKDEGSATKATLVAFPKFQSQVSGFAWKGMYGEPFNRNFVHSYRRVMRTGASFVCSFPKGDTK